MSVALARRPEVSLAAAAVTVALAWVPFYREPGFVRSVSVWDLHDARPRAFWFTVVDLALVVVALLGVAATNRRPAGSPAARGLRTGLAACGAAAVALTLALGFVPTMRLRTAVGCLGWYSPSPRPQDCRNVGIDLVPATGWVSALVLAALATALAASGVVRTPATVRLPAHLGVALARGGGLLVLAAACTPVYRRVGTELGPDDGLVGRTVLHSPYAVATVLLAAVAAWMVRTPGRFQRAASAAAVLAWICALAAGAALPVDDGVGTRSIAGVRTVVNLLRPDWGYWVLLAGATLLVLGVASIRAGRTRSAVPLATGA